MAVVAVARTRQNAIAPMSNLLEDLSDLSVMCFRSSLIARRGEEEKRNSGVATNGEQTQAEACGYKVGISRGYRKMIIVLDSVFRKGYDRGMRKGGSKEVEGRRAVVFVVGNGGRKNMCFCETKPNCQTAELNVSLYTEE